jgi:PAS domain S-box-containing protein
MKGRFRKIRAAVKGICMRSADRTRRRRKTGREVLPELAPEALRAHTHTLGPILESVADGVVVVDLEGRFVLFNQSAERILGVGSTDVTPQGWTEAYRLFLPDAITPYPPDQLPLARALRGETVTDIEIFVRNPSISEGVWISVNATPWKDAAGEPQGAIAVFRDITARKKTDETVERLSNAVEQTADSVVITDRNGVMLYVNPAFEQTTGYGRDEALGQTPRLLRSGKQDATFYRDMWSTLLAGRAFRGTLVNRKKSGELFHVEQTVTPMRDGAGSLTHFVSVWKDVTELRKAAQRELEVQLAQRVQQKLYPRRAPRLPGIDIAGAAYPADSMCGDYFDYITMPEGRLGIVVGDVTGHGLAPALVMVETRAWLHSLMRRDSDLDAILHRVNDTLMEDLERNHFVTMLLASLDIGGRSLMYANAGHPAGYVLGSSGEVKVAMESTRVPLGVVSDLRGLPQETISLEPGDTLLFLTDGILESQEPGGAFFGAEKTLALVRSHIHEPAQRILESLYQGVRDFTGDGLQLDDVTAVICKMDGRE